MDKQDPPAAIGTESSAQPAPAGTAGLDFDKAAFAAPVAPKACAACKRTIANEYYEIRGQVICTSCRDQIVGGMPDQWAFPRALLYGGLMALAGTLVWALIIHFTGYELGLIAILVGIGVGMAVRKGSRGRGGWKYQALAMALTYLSITTSYVPIILKGVVKNAKEHAAAVAPDAKKGAEQVADSKTADGEHGPAKARVAPSKVPVPVAILAFLALVWGLALAAPFLAGSGNIMGLIIIGVGLYEAWRFNRAAKVSGPFRLAPEAPIRPAGASTL